MNNIIGLYYEMQIQLTRCTFKHREMTMIMYNIKFKDIQYLSNILFVISIEFYKMQIKISGQKMHLAPGAFYLC
jgi:uncharacterized protein YpiB (UPF0302 family)